MVVTFAEVTFKNKVLEAARDKGYLMFKEERILVFKDLAPEALVKKTGVERNLGYFEEHELETQMGLTDQAAASFQGQDVLYKKLGGRAGYSAISGNSNSDDN